MRVKFQRLHDGAILPSRATEHSACFDLFVPKAPLSTRRAPDTDSIVIGTKIAVEMPPGYAMLIFSRSGHGFQHGIRLANCVGVIDSDYRGEIMVKLRGDAPGSARAIDSIEPGHRIAQAMFIVLPTVEIEEVGKLSQTARGAGGLGSTGA